MLSASLAAAEMNEGAVAAESGLKAAGRCASERKRSWEDGGGGVEGERDGVVPGRFGHLTASLAAVPRSPLGLPPCQVFLTDKNASENYCITASSLWRGEAEVAALGRFNQSEKSTLQLLMRE
jgi:hypothetical protein